MNENNYPPLRQHELAARLPASARRKFAALKAQIEDAVALVNASQARRVALETAVIAAQQRAALCERSDDAAAKRQAGEDLEAARAALDKIDAERAKRTSVMANCQQILSRLDAWVPAALAGIGEAALAGPLRPVAISAKPKPGESIADAVGRVRALIAAAESDLVATRALPPPADEIKRACRAEVERLREFGCPKVAFESGQVVVRWPDAPRFAAKGAAIGAPAGSVAAMLAWLFPQQLYDALIQGADAVRGITAAERSARIAKLEKRILELEHEEESLIEQALAAGLEAHRRPSANPLALLGIEIVPLEQLAAAE